MPAPLAALAIPLISTEAVSGALTMLGIAGTAAAAGVAVGTAINKNSSSQEILTASDQFNAAQRDINMATSLSNTGGLTNEDKATIVAKYPYLTLDAGGNPAVKSDPATASGGSLQVQVDTNTSNITISNNVIGTQYPLESTDGPQNYAVNNLVTTIAQTSSDPNLEAFAANNTPAYNQSTLTKNDLLDTGVAGQNVSVASVDYLGTTPTDIGTASTQQSYVAPGFRSGALDQLPDNSISRPQQSLPAFTQVGVSGRPLVQTDENGLVVGSQVSPYSLAAAQSYAGSVAAAASISPSPSLPPAPPVGVSTTQYSSNDYATVNATQNSSTNSAGGSGGSVRGNILHNYTNYTYRFSLWAAGKDAINGIGLGSISTSDPSSILAGAECILADGGFGNYTPAQEFRKTVLGIDNVIMETSVGNGAETRGSDVVKMTFDIMEPYTVSFMGRLAKMCNRGNFSYAQGDVGNLFMVLKLEFLGYDDYGSPVTIDATKYFPINLIKIEFSIEKTRGAVYNITASPATHVALTQLDNQIPFHVEIKAQTVDELFNGPSSYGGGSQASGAAAQRATEKSSSSGSASGPSTVTKGLSQALNDNESYKLKQGYITTPNEYKFTFKNDEIKNAKLLDPNVIKEKSVTMSDNKANPAQIMAGKQGKLTVSSDKSSFRAQAGTKIIDFINQVMVVTNYMTDQYKPSANKNAPVKMWKIFPVVYFGEIDPKTNFFQRKVNYIVDQYYVFGLDHPNFGQQEIPGIVKIYDYMFTGKNTDVLDVQLKFVGMWVEIRNGAKKGYTENANDTIGIDPTSQQAAPADTTQDTRIIKPKYLFANGIANRQNSGSTTQTNNSLGVTELMEKLLDNDMDLQKLELTIVGDPDWIQQDYYLYGPSMPVGMTMPNGTITYHQQPAYFYFQFYAPQDDYDEYTGLFANGEQNSAFSGKYQVMKVTSEFKNGKFTQQLTNLRVRNQQNTQPTSQTRTDTAPSTPGFKSGANDPVPAERTQVTPVSVTTPSPVNLEPTGGPNIVSALQFGIGA
jgi:hypothetical protein